MHLLFFSALWQWYAGVHGRTHKTLSAKTWRFELYYWDFSIGILLFALLMAFTFGSMGNQGRSFLADLRQADTGNLLSAAVGGVIWNIGTLLLVAAISIAGMSVAFPIGGGIGWTLGILINYMGKPEGNPLFLFSGTAFIILAILLSMQSYKKLAAHQKKPTLKGILLSLLAGLCIAFFYRFVASALATDFSPAEAGKISSYTAVVFFSIGALICTAILNPFFMAKPVQGEPVKMSEWFKRRFEDTFARYARRGNMVPWKLCKLHGSWCCKPCNLLWIK